MSTPRKNNCVSCLLYGILSAIALVFGLVILVKYLPYLLGGIFCILIYRHIKSPKPKWGLIILTATGTLLIGSVWARATKQIDNSPNEAPVVEPTQVVAKNDENVEDTAEKKTEEPKTFLVTRVIDGDTIEIEGGQRIRYIGIDTPETPNDCYAQEAMSKNEKLVGGKRVFLEKDISETDRYGRLLRYVYIDGTFVNDALVSEGYAKASSYPPDIKYQEKFVASEGYAMRNELGLWGPVCNKPTCIYGTEVGRYCSECNYASVTKQNPDCSEFSKLEWDGSCSYLCPVEPAPVVTTPTTPATPTYNCNCSKTCPKMSSCEEAYYQLNVCRCKVRDGDKDGVPCENICPGG